MIQGLWDKHNIYEYRRIINEAAYSCNPDKLNKYALMKEEKRYVKNFFRKKRR